LVAFVRVPTLKELLLARFSYVRAALPRLVPVEAPVVGSTSQGRPLEASPPITRQPAAGAKHQVCRVSREE
jgi:hypothetical protein